MRKAAKNKPSASLKIISDIQHDPIDIEVHFSSFIKNFGGSLVSDLLDTKHPPFKNADFAFNDSKIIAELKVLKKDLAERKLIHKIASLYKEWFETDFFNSKMLSNEQQQTLYNILRKPLKRLIQKANEQIKETKKNLNLEEYRGLLLICNDGLYGLSTEVLFSICCNILSREYSSCDGLVYFTVNRYSDIPDNDYANLLWIPAYGNNAGDLDQFVNELGRKWFVYLEKIIGGFDSKLEDPEGYNVLKAKYIQDR